jgi:hypothetical protein
MKLNLNFQGFVAYTIKIDSILNARLVDFPKVNPAIVDPRENTVYFQ